MTDLVKVALISALPSTILAAGTLIAAIRNGFKTDAVHLAVNSRLSELLEVTRSSSHAKGVADEQARQSAP